MADGRTNQGAGDRARAAGGEPYEVEYFANKHGLRQQQACALIQAIGNDREKLDAAAERVAGLRSKNRG